MLAALLLDPRLAFFSLCALLIGAATPLAIAWSRLLPEEQPPFRFQVSSEGKTSTTASSPERSNAGRDHFAITLLVFVTLSFLWQLPGFPRDFVVSRAAALIPEPWLHGLLLFFRGFFIAIPAVAAAYSLLRLNEIRLPLIIAGILIPLLWFVTPWLRASLLAP